MYTFTTRFLVASDNRHKILYKAFTTRLLVASDNCHKILYKAICTHYNQFVWLPLTTPSPWPLAALWLLRAGPQSFRDGR